MINTNYLPEVETKEDLPPPESVEGPTAIFVREFEMLYVCVPTIDSMVWVPSDPDKEEVLTEYNKYKKFQGEDSLDFYSWLSTYFLKAMREVNY